jgi:hypothetical protein
LAVDSAANVYVADTANLTIRKVTPGGVPDLELGVGEHRAPRCVAQGQALARGVRLRGKVASDFENQAQRLGARIGRRALRQGFGLAIDDLRLTIDEKSGVRRRRVKDEG